MRSPIDQAIAADVTRELKRKKVIVRAAAGNKILSVGLLLRIPFK